MSFIKKLALGSFALYSMVQVEKAARRRIAKKADASPPKGIDLITAPMANEADTSSEPVADKKPKRSKRARKRAAATAKAA